LAELVERGWVEGEKTLAAGACAADDADALEHAKMLGDSLARECCGVGELRNGVLLAVGETDEQLQARLVAECGEEAGLGTRTAFAARGFE
jgi:hypothetical protein